MKKLYWFTLKSFLGPFVMTFFITLFVLLMQFLWKYIEDLVGKGLDFYVLSKLLFYISASLIPMALPLAILLASLMTFGNLGETYELTAIKSAGISLQKIMRPLILVNIIVSIAAFFFSNDVIPVANLKMRALLYDIQRQKPEFNIKEGAFYSGIEGYRIKIGEKDKKNNALYNVKIYNHTENRGNVSLTMADSGYMGVTDDQSKLIITLFSGYNYQEVTENNNNKRTYPHRKDKFERQDVVMDLTGFGLERSDENLFKSSYKMLNVTQLQQYVDSAKIEIDKKKEIYHNNIVTSNYLRTQPTKIQQPILIDSVSKFNFQSYNTLAYFDTLVDYQRKTSVKQAISFVQRAKEYSYYEMQDFNNRAETIARYNIEWHRKFTLSAACLIFFFIGAPLGAIIRKGGFGMPIIISVAFFIFYYIISLSFEKYCKTLIMEPYLGMWAPSLILLPIGVFLTYKATHDSSILNLDTYSNFFKRIGIAGKKKAQVPMFQKFNMTTIDVSNTKDDKINQSLENLENQFNETIQELNKHLTFGNFRILNMVYFQNDVKNIELVRFYRNTYGIVHAKYDENPEIINQLEKLPYIPIPSNRKGDVSMIIDALLLTIFFPLGIIAVLLSYHNLILYKSKIEEIRLITQNVIDQINTQKQ